MNTVTTPEDAVLAALSVLEADGDAGATAALNDIDVPLYVTDAEGVVTYYNPACIPFAGRTPRVHADRWCVTWKLFTRDGQALPHDRCPMATAVTERRAVRGLTAIAQRPDGSRVVFMPYPTPIIRGGEFVGAFNLLVDVTETAASDLWVQADKARRLARAVLDATTAETLEDLAADYEAQALQLGGRPRAPAPRAH